MTRQEQALKLHNEGYNCAQCVACVFNDILNEDERLLFRMTEAFGAGMGCTKTCGAVTAMGVVIGLLTSDGNMEKPATKGKSYRLMRESIKEFEEKNKSVICRELKGIDTGKVLRSCNGCIADAVEILEKKMLSEEVTE